MKKILLRIYFECRTWWPFWFYILNARPRRLLRKNHHPLTGVQKKVVTELSEHGIAMTSLEELFPGEKIEEQLCTYAQELRGTHTPESKKKYVHEFWDLFPILDIENPFVRLSIRPEVLAIMNEYMQMWVRLNQYQLAEVQPVGNEAPVDSQRWHRDPEEKRLCKMFVYLTDVDEEAGPFMFVPDSTYGKIYGTVAPQKSPLGSYPAAGFVEARIPKERVRIMTGKRGSVIFADPVGLHRGGYAKSKARLMFTAAYSAPTWTQKIRHSIPAGFNPKDYGLDENQQYALNVAQ